MWKIEKVVKKGEYLYAVVKEHPNAIDHGYVLHHRVVMENHLGRLLTKGEVVHHKDGNKHNNNVDNLEVMDKQEHNRLHASKGRTLVRLTCVNCGIEFTREKRQVKGKGLCSRRCNGQWNQKNTSWKGRGKRK
jgi:hypothetical protein